MKKFPQKRRYSSSEVLEVHPKTEQSHWEATMAPCQNFPKIGSLEGDCSGGGPSFSSLEVFKERQGDPLPMILQRVLL